MKVTSRKHPLISNEGASTDKDLIPVKCYNPWIDIRRWKTPKDPWLTQAAKRHFSPEEQSWWGTTWNCRGSCHLIVFGNSNGLICNSTTFLQKIRHLKATVGYGSILEDPGRRL
ncbi:hypothetical protein C0J52_02242 [Blattella germanica]|nr:hypothetical protein C0J52_02242 [Blattella germanica]